MTNKNIGLKSTLEVLSTVAVLVASGFVIWSLAGPRPALNVATGQPRSSAVALPKVALSVSDAATHGASSAKVGIVLFSEFQCPYCQKFATDTWPQLAKEYVEDGRVMLVFRNLPLTRIHPHAQRAAEIGACADGVGAFWKVHDAFFAGPKIAGESDLFARAEQAGLSRPSWTSCLQDGRAAARVEQDIKLAADLGVTGTPVFFIGKLSDGRVTPTQVLVGARSVAEFRRILDPLLAQD